MDSGLAYDLPLFRDRLARDGEGMPLGYDFWDLDPWPYDGDTSRGPFLPIRHGTAVASVLAREAPDSRAHPVPLSAPRHDPHGRELVHRAADAGARILAMPLGSRNPEDWRGFERALGRHDILAVVSAGNNGRDIDRGNPVYPAASALENILVVTSADGFGRLARGSNWGRESVDVMLPAENVGDRRFSRRFRDRFRLQLRGSAPRRACRPAVWRSEPGLDRGPAQGPHPGPRDAVPL